MYRFCALPCCAGTNHFHSILSEANIFRGLGAHRSLNLQQDSFWAPLACSTRFVKGRFDIDVGHRVDALHTASETFPDGLTQQAVLLSSSSYVPRLRDTYVVLHTIYDG
jgi:hypothetical protein